MEENTPASQRRGSGISISLSPSNNAVGGVITPAHAQNGMQMTGGQPMYQQGPYGPMYMQSPSYPVLMNPPHMPTYVYGIPPSPVMSGMPPGGMVYMPPDRQQPQQFQMRRAGSFNAKMMSQDARRPFAATVAHQQHNRNVSDDEYGIVAVPDNYQAYNNSLPRGASMKKGDVFSHYDGDQDGNQPPYPGVIIEEMIDSASQIGEREDETKANNKMGNSESDSVLGRDQFSAAIPQRAPVRWKHSTPMNTIMMFVPQQESWVVERMGKYNKILEPGLNVLVPLLDKVKYVQSLKEIAIEIPQQTAITVDNVTLNIDGVLYLRIRDPYKASYGVEDPEFAITQLAQTTMRSEIGKITMDTLFRERDNLNRGIVLAINAAADAWGIECLRYEIRDIRMPGRVQEAMQMQVEAERKKRAAILESEGIKSAEINVAEGKKQSRILASEAEKQELINEAIGQAEAVVAAGRARAQSIELVSAALCNENGQNAAALAVAEKYVGAFGNLAKTNNTLILPANTGDVSSMVAQAMTIYGQLEGRKDMNIAQKVLKPIAEESVIDASAVSSEVNGQ